MSTHTKEPWEIRHVNNQPFIAAKPYEGHPYFNRTSTIEVMSDEDYPTKEADARRIVACVNACAGLPQGALDGGWTARGMSEYAIALEQRRDELIAQRDELLAALKAAKETLANRRRSLWRNS